jgi:hypothetical protein
MVDALRGTHPDLPVDTQVVAGTAAQAAVEASEGADLLVVGCRGHTAFAGALIGSVSLHCVHQAHRSSASIGAGEVVLVPPGPQEVHPFLERSGVPTRSDAHLLTDSQEGPGCPGRPVCFANQSAPLEGGDQLQWGSRLAVVTDEASVDDSERVGDQGPETLKPRTNLVLGYGVAADRVPTPYSCHR